MGSKTKLYLKLFLSTFHLSSFTFGGGFVIIPLMKKRFVDDLQWIDEEEVCNLTTVAQSSPGAVAVNASILMGYKIGGFPGALVTILGTILPPLIILSVISLFYVAFKENIVINALLKGMQAGVAAVILNVVIDLGKNVLKEKSFIPIVTMACAFVAVFFLEINIIFIILACGFIGVAEYFITGRQPENVVEGEGCKRDIS